MQYIDTGTIRIGSSVQQFPTGATWTLANIQSAVNAGGWLDLNGFSQTVGALNFYGSASSVNSQSGIFLGSGGVLTIGGTITTNAHYNTQAAFISGTNGAAVNLQNAQRAITVYRSLNLGAGEAEFVIDADIIGGGTSGQWYKSGGGTLRMKGLNQLTGTLSNRFDAGTTLLDYAPVTALQASLNNTNRLNPLGTIELRGGTVTFLGSSLTPIVQNVAGLIFPAAANSNTGAYSSVGIVTSAICAPVDFSTTAQ